MRHPLPADAAEQPPSSPTTAMFEVDQDTARQLQSHYRAWALASGWSVVSETDTVTGWSLVIEGGDVLVITSFYEPRAMLCIQADV